MEKLKNFVRKNPAFTVFFLLTLGVIAIAVFAPVLATHEPYEAVLADAVPPPGPSHWFVTDRLGRAPYARVIC